MTPPRRSRFQEPRASASPQERRKLATLVVLAGVIILLLWISTMPWNYRTQTGTAGSRTSSFFNTIREQINEGSAALSDRDTNTNQTNQ